MDCGKPRRLVNAAVTGHLANGTRFLSGFLIPRFGGWSDIGGFIPLVISEKSECFVRVSSAHVGWPSLRTRTATGIDVDGGMRGRMAGTLAISLKRHVVTPAQSYTQSPEERAIGEVENPRKAGRDLSGTIECCGPPRVRSLASRAIITLTREHEAPEF
jgi:hypothetical protein